MMSCALALLSSLSQLMESVRCMLNLGGFLAPLSKKVELYDAANPLPQNRMRGAYFRHCGNWAW